LDSRFNFRGSGKQGTCFQICLKQLRKALEIQGAISDFNLFWTAVLKPTFFLPKEFLSNPINCSGLLLADVDSLTLDIKPCDSSIHLRLLATLFIFCIRQCAFEYTSIFFSRMVLFSYSFIALSDLSVMRLVVNNLLYYLLSVSMFK